MEDKNGRYIVTVYVGLLSEDYEALSVEASKHTTAEEIVSCIVQKLGFPNAHEFELAEVIGNSVGQECKERRISSYESPVALKLLWPKVSEPTSPDKKLQQSKYSSLWNSSSVESYSPNVSDCYRFCLREKLTDSLWNESFVKDTQFIRDYFYRFHFRPTDKEYPDLCQLPDLNEQTLLESLKSRFNAGHIYSYVGSILIAVNPFKFYPIYNPKYVKLYQNRRREELPPHIFAIADVAYHTMLKEKRNQCIVISGESGSGKTESTNFLLHHLTALTQKGTHGSGVEQTILSAGPVLEAFGNAKTAHNNNSSRFGKFIQVSYRENGMVHGSIVQKFLLEKSRICCQAPNERNYHVFYYLLAGASDTDRELLKLLPPNNYHYLNQSGCYTLDAVDESYEFSRLKQSMEMVGFGVDKQRQQFSVLSAVLLLGNVKFVPKKSSYHDESVLVKNPEVVRQISSLLRVTQETLMASLTSKRARVSGEMLVINYRMPEAIAARDAMAKCLYGALFDWIVLQLNHALLSKKWNSATDYRGKSIGVLDIFGFEDFQNCNSFEQYCINYANEHLQHYFNQHVFKYEQEEYKKEGIRWTNIEFLDNSPCLSLIEAKPNGLICILDDQCNFPGATNETLLQKFNSVHKDHKFYEVPQKREEAFVICHYAGKVKYQVVEFREKNMDLMRQSFIQSFKNSNSAFVRELVGIDPVAVFRWAIVRAFFRAVFAFRSSGKVAAANRRHRSGKENSTFNRAGPGFIYQRSSMASDQLVKKSRSFRLAQMTRGMKNLRSVKTLASHLAAIGVSTKNYNPRKQPISVSQQFQQSLHSLMVTLNQANPFFIRCIKSNSDKNPNVFDDAIVQRQLRYTGMLETVRIRQAGYNVRLNYDEFIHLYRILLPKGLKSERHDVDSFLRSLHLNPSNYQLGQHKVYLRETEKIKLDYFLHQQILASIVCIQRWYRAILERRHFLRVQEAIVTLQSYVRMFLAQRYVANMRMMHLAATFIQKMWRGYRVRKWYQNIRKSCVQFQARVRGNMLRERFQTILNNHRKLSRERNVIDLVTVQENHKSLSRPVNNVPTAKHKDMFIFEGVADNTVVRKPKSRAPPPKKRIENGGILHHSLSDIPRHIVSDIPHHSVSDISQHSVSDIPPLKNPFVKTTRSKSETIGRRLKRKQSKTHVDTSIKQHFSLTGTSEFTDAADQIISDVRELQLMQEFISAKIFQVSNKEGEKSSKVDKVFQQALREFKESLVSSFSVASKQGGIMQLSITYKDLISYFANIMETVCKQQGIGSDFPTTMGVNALRGFLNEFMNDNRVEEKPKLTKGRKKIKRNKRQKGDETINYLGHSFVTMVVYIPTACEICSSFIMWPIERGVVCQKCKLACHKKCHLKLQIECNEGYARGNNNCSDCGVFGSPLDSLIPENGTVPPVVEQLVSVIEFYGLRQEGLYRKSGVSSSVKELKNDIKDGKKIEWESYSVHVFTSVLKSFFRELPEPLLTFELYDEFLRAADMSQEVERIRAIFSLFKKLPKPNYDLMERLVFHLVRVAMYESNNRMNANSLAIVFAPCILRTNKARQVQESLTDISRQTSCLETIIAEQLKKFKSTWSNIESVDSAAYSMSGRLNSIRTKVPSERLKQYSGSGSSLKNPSPESVCNIPVEPENMSAEEEEAYIKRHIEHLKNEKAMLTTLLPSLSSRTPSDDEMLSTDPEVESSAGSVDDLHHTSLSSPTHVRTLTFPDKSSDCSGLATCQECLSTSQSRQPGPSLLPHNVIKTKNRGPWRKAPSRFVRNQFSLVNFGEDDEAEDMYDLNSDLEDSKEQSNDEDDEGAIMV